VKVVLVLLTIVLALVVQMALSRYAVGGRWVFDLVLVGVVYAGLYWGPVSGLWAGTLGGLLQDALSGDVIGMGGFAKTVAGFGAGLAGRQFLVGGTLMRVAAVAVATLGHRLIMIGLVATVNQDWTGVPWSALLMETFLNATAGFLVFQVTEMVPGALRQSRLRRRSSLSRRRW
jgi:rod shape-determining protein MreD